MSPPFFFPDQSKRHTQETQGFGLSGRRVRRCTEEVIVVRVDLGPVQEGDFIVVPCLRRWNSK